MEHRRLNGSLRVHFCSLQGGRVYAMPAVKDVHNVTVTFPLPSLQAAYAAKVLFQVLNLLQPLCCARQH